MGEEALVKKWRVTRRESIAFGWVSKNNIATEHSQIHPCSSYLDSAECILDENIKATGVRCRYKFVAQQVKSIPVSNGSIPDEGLAWRGRAISRAVPIPGPVDEWFISKFFH
jgi:hypothetical protein